MLHRSTLLGMLMVIWGCLSTFVDVPVRTQERVEPSLPMRIPVLVVKCFPVNGELIDQVVTGDIGPPLEQMGQKTEEMTRELSSHSSRVLLTTATRTGKLLPAWFTLWRERTSSWSRFPPSPVLARKSS
jgi:hypothetical protein